MRKNYFRRIVFEFSQRNKAGALQLGSPIGSSKTLHIPIEGRMFVVQEHTISPPISKPSRRAGVGVISRTIGRLPFSKDDTDQIVRVRGVVAFLHRGGNFVVRLSSYIR